MIFPIDVVRLHPAFEENVLVLKRGRRAVIRYRNFIRYLIVCKSCVLCMCVCGCLSVCVSVCDCIYNRWAKRERNVVVLRCWANRIIEIRTDCR